MRQLVPALFSLKLYWREEWVLPLEASRPISSGITTTTPWTILKRRVSLCCRRCSSRARRCSSFRSCVALHCWRGERYWHHLVSGFWTCSVAFFFCAAKCVCVCGWVGGWLGGGRLLLNIRDQSGWGWYIFRLLEFRRTFFEVPFQESEFLADLGHCLSDVTREL